MKGFQDKSVLSETLEFAEQNSVRRTKREFYTEREKETILRNLWLLIYYSNTAISSISEMELHCFCIITKEEIKWLIVLKHFKHLI